MTRLTVNPYTITDIKYNALSMEQLKKLPTPRLLAYYKRYRHLGWSYSCWCCDELLTKKDRLLNSIANEYLDAIKALLDTREHVSK